MDYLQTYANPSKSNIFRLPCREELIMGSESHASAPSDKYWTFFAQSLPTDIRRSDHRSLPSMHIQTGFWNEWSPIDLLRGIPWMLIGSSCLACAWRFSWRPSLVECGCHWAWLSSRNKMRMEDCRRLVISSRLSTFICSNQKFLGLHSLHPELGFKQGSSRRIVRP